MLTGCFCCNVIFRIFWTQQDKKNIGKYSNEQGIWKSARVQSSTFGAKSHQIGLNCKIVLFGQNLTISHYLSIIALFLTYQNLYRSLKDAIALWRIKFLLTICWISSWNWMWSSLSWKNIHQAFFVKPQGVWELFRTLSTFLIGLKVIQSHIQI